MLTRRTLGTLVGLCFTGLAVSAGAQTKWDLPSAYPASNLHTENLAQFVKDVDAATGGKLKIQVHDNASLFKAPEIKRAVQGGQAQAVRSCWSTSRTNGRCGGWTACPSWPPATAIRKSCGRPRGRPPRPASPSRA